MRKNLLAFAAPLLIVALACVALAGRADGLVVRVGNLILTDTGGITPRKLPRHEQAPISAIIDGRIGSADGSHPPAMESADIDIDRTIEIDGTGLPACRRGQLEARTTEEAKRACRGAIVGSGSGSVEVAFDEQPPFSANGPIVLFNGGTKRGRSLLFIHAYVAVPAPTAVIATVTLKAIHRGHYGVNAYAKIPRIAGGAGSATHFRLRIGRKFTYRGKPRSYLTARCPTGHYFTEGDLRLTGGITFHVFHPLPCTPAD